ncbi:MAG: ABC transporter substrate-binding protein [Pleomorphochaeta sp.]
MIKKFLMVMLCVLVSTSMLFAGGQEEEKALDATVDENWPDMTWEQVLAEADGQTVNFYMWGGGTSYNNFVDNVLGEAAEEYGVTINRVGVTNITEAVNTVIGEKAAGKVDGGTVDIFWINGSNFMMMQQAGVTFPEWSEAIPNAKHVNWDNPSIKFDMGYPVNGQESPWMTAQFQLIYNSDLYSKDELPKNYTEFMAFAKANPGVVTYPGIPDFHGTRFIKAAMYELTGGFEQYNRDDITKEEFEEMTEPVWEYFEELEPYLWKEGKTYPSSTQQLELYNNGESVFSVTMNGMGIYNDIQNGKYPEASKVYCLDTSIADTNYVALTFNGAHKAGAMVIANIIADPFIQAKNISSTGGAPAIDSTTLTDEQTEAFAKELAKLAPGTYVEASEKARTTAPEISSYLNIYIEEIWNERIGSN